MCPHNRAEVKRILCNCIVIGYLKNRVYIIYIFYHYFILYLILKVFFSKVTKKSFKVIFLHAQTVASFKNKKHFLVFSQPEYIF